MLFSLVDLISEIFNFLFEVPELIYFVFSKGLRGLVFAQIHQVRVDIGNWVFRFVDKKLSYNFDKDFFSFGVKGISHLIFI